MATESESLKGWNDTCVLVGRNVRVRAAGFGTRCVAKVIEFRGYPDPSGTVLIQLVKVGKTRSGWSVGNKTTVFRGWLEGEPMI